MNRKMLLERIWSEKRKKSLTDEKHPTGVNISSHTFALLKPERVLGDMLALLVSEPVIAVEWAQNWGRTICTVHPAHTYSVAFTNFRSQHERLGAMVQSAEVAHWSEFHPVVKVKDGFFKIILSDEPTTREALFLQIERMLDELVWCLFLHLQIVRPNTEKSLLYQTAAVIVQSRGVSVTWKSTEQILRDRIDNPNLIVRIYGNVMGNGALPIVIGSVDSRQFTEICVRGQIQLLPASSSHAQRRLMMHEVACHNVHFLNDVQGEKLPKDTPLVATAITIGKRAHLGHLLTGVIAEAARVFCRSQHLLIIDANDDSESMKQTVLRLAEVLNLDVVEVVRLLSIGGIKAVDIENAYVSRALNKSLIPTSVVLPPLSFSSMVACIREQFREVGILTDIQCVSTRREEVRRMVQTLRAPGMPVGFSHCVVNKGKRARLHVLEKQGRETASVVRASLVSELAKSTTSVNRQQLVFFDMDPSIHQAAELLQACGSRFELLVAEGVGIGIGTQISSASEGTAIPLHDVFAVLEDVAERGLWFATLLYWMHVSTHMAPSVHERSVLTPNPLGPSFLCFGSKDAMMYSLKEAAGFVEDFARRLRNAVEYTQKASMVADDMLLRTRLIKLMKDLRTSQVVTRPEPVRLSCRSEEVRKVSLQYACASIREVDTAIARYVLDNPQLSAQDLMRTLRMDGLVRDTAQLPRRLNGHVSIRHVEMLVRAGFSPLDIPSIVQRSLSGNLGLYRRRVLLLEYTRDCLERQHLPQVQVEEQAVRAYCRALEHVAMVCKISL